MVPEAAAIIRKNLAKKRRQMLWNLQTSSEFQNSCRPKGSKIMENAALAFLVGSAGVVGGLTILAGALIENRKRRQANHYHSAFAWENASGTHTKVQSTNPRFVSQLGRYPATHSGQRPANPEKADKRQFEHNQKTKRASGAGNALA